MERFAMKQVERWRRADPGAVARKVVQVATSRRPKLRYLVGVDARIINPSARSRPPPSRRRLSARSFGAEARVWNGRWLSRDRYGAEMRRSITAACVVLPGAAERTVTIPGRDAMGPLTRVPCNTRIVSMKNVTVTLDEETARWARVEAARREMSVSSFVRLLLREHMGGQAAYSGAMARYLSRRPAAISDGRYPSRDEVHDRAGLR
jgi:hypothetical protein